MELETVELKGYRVGHLKFTFFESTDTMIYQYLKNMVRFIPLCLSWQQDNIRSFPFPAGSLVDLSQPLTGLAGLTATFFKHVLHRDYYVERVIRERRIEVLHAHSLAMGLQVLKLARKLNLPLVTSIYGAEFGASLDLASLRPAYETLFACGDLFLVEGEAARKKLETLGCSPAKIERQPPAIRVWQYPFLERRPRGMGRVHLLFCADFTSESGQHQALEALQQVWAQHRDIHLLAVGAGKGLENLGNQIRERHLEDRVTLKSALTFREYLQIAAQADILLHPGLTLEGGFEDRNPVVLEAQAMGLPVLTTCYPGMTDMVVADRSALLNAPGDCDALARNIIFLMENQYLWSSMGKTGRAFVEEYHDIKKEAANLEEKYKRVLKNKR